MQPLLALDVKGYNSVVHLQDNYAFHKSGVYVITYHIVLLIGGQQFKVPKAVLAFTISSYIKLSVKN